MGFFDFLKSSKPSWNFQDIEQEFIETDDFSEFFEFHKKVNLLPNLTKNEENSLKVYYRNERNINYEFLRNLCSHLEGKLDENKNWSLDKNVEKRLYDLKFKSSVSKDDFRSFCDLTVSSISFRQITKFLNISLNKYDALKKDNPTDFNFIKLLLDRIEMIHNYLKNQLEYLSVNIDYNRLEGGSLDDYDNLILKVDFDDLEDIGEITHYKGKPFVGIAYEKNDKGELISEYNYLNGLKQGVCKEYNESKESFYYYYKDDEELANMSFYADENNQFSEYDVIYFEGKQLVRVYNNRNIIYYSEIRHNPDDEVKYVMSYANDSSKDGHGIKFINDIKKNSTEWKNVVQLNFAFAEGGFKQLYSNELNEKSVPSQLLDKKGNKGDAYLNGEPFTGTSYGLHLNGKLAETLCFNNGKQNGISKVYNEDGELILLYYWIDGVNFSAESNEIFNNLQL